MCSASAERHCGRNASATGSADVDSPVGNQGSAVGGRRASCRPCGAGVCSMRGDPRPTDTRTGVCWVLGLHPASHAAPVRSLRRCTPHMAIDERLGRAVSPLPPDAARGRPGARDWRVRRRAEGGHPCVEIRRPPFARSATGRIDARAWRGCARRRPLAGPCTAASVTPPEARLQPGCGSGPPSRPSSSGGAPPHPADPYPDWTAAGATPSQRAGRIRLGARIRRPGRDHHRAHRRCQYDRRHARCLCSCVERGGGPRGTGPYRSTSRERTSLNTASAMASLPSSPSNTAQPPSTACRL